MNDRMELLREMLRDATPSDWDTLRGTFKDGYARAIEVVDQWSGMTSAPAVAHPEPLILGDSSCAEAPS